MHHDHDHDRPYTLRILGALVVTALYYGVVLGLSIRLGLTVARTGDARWVSVPVGIAVGLAALGWCTLTWLAIRLREEPPIEEVHEHAFPELVALVRQTAAEVGVAAPNGIFVSHRPNGFSLFWGVLGLNVRYTGLGLGLPLVPVLTTAQVKGLIAHELGHMQSLRQRAGDGWYTWAMYSFWSCSETLARSTTWMKLACPQVWYAWAMTHLTWPVACQEELAADACAVRAVPPAEHAGALEGIAVAQEMWREFLEVEVGGLLNLDILPLNVFEGFRRHAAERSYADREALLARYHAHDATRAFDGLAGAEGVAAPAYGIMPEDRWDPHPRLDRRVDHLFAQAPVRAYRAVAPGTLRAPDLALERRLTRRVLAPLIAGREDAPWHRVEWRSLADVLHTPANRAKRRAPRPAPARSC